MASGVSKCVGNLRESDCA